VAWRVVSADGHPISGDFTFDHAPPAGADEAAGAAGPRCAVAAGPGPDGPPGAGDAGDAEPAGAQPSAGVIVAVALGTALLGGAVVLVIVLAGRHGRGPEDGHGPEEPGPG
jgi:copper resistance protein C